LEYLQWNSVISNYFFNPEKAGKEVLLYITKNEISRLGVKHLNFLSEEESWEDYCEVVSKGLRNGGRKRLLSDNIKFAINEWDKYSKWIYEKGNQHPFEIDNIPVTDPVSSVAYPFFIAFIPALIIPLTELTTGVRANSYYEPLLDFLKINKISDQKEGTSTFGKIDPIWNQLEKWSKEYCKTDLGIFTERLFGNQLWRYVGKLFSQYILSPKNIREIPKMFWEADIAPFSFISDEQLERIIIKHGSKVSGFSPKAISTFNDIESPLKKIILDIVRREFENWSGDVIDYEDDGHTLRAKSGWFYATLLSAFTLVPKNETFHHFYHLFSKNDFPEDLIFNGSSVFNLSNGFSEKINSEFNPDLEWIDIENKWKATPSKSEMLLFISGAYFGLSSDTYIETDKISRVSKMYLLCPQYKGDSIDEWGKTFENGNFKKINYLYIPDGYILYRFQNPKLEHPSEQLLKFDNDRKISLKGGIKVSNREFLATMQPTIWFPGANGIEKVFIQFSISDEIKFLSMNSSVPEEFFLPDDIQTDEDFFIRSDSGKLEGDDIPYKIIGGSFSPLDIVEDNLAKRNKRGELCSPNDTQFVRGSNTIYGNWLRQHALTHEFFPGFYNTVPFQICNDIYNSTGGNLILECLTLKRNAKFVDFSIIIETLANSTSIWEDKSFQVNPKYVKQQAISYYDYSGFLDYDYSLDRITINKPQIVLIPAINCVEAILIGGRTTTFVSELIEACNKVQINVQIIPQQNQLQQYLLPDTIKLIPSGLPNATQAWLCLKKLALQLTIEFYTVARPIEAPQIIQFGLQDFSENLGGYKEYILQNNVVNIKDFAWARKTFSLETLFFEKGSSEEVNKQLSLQEYFLQYKYRYILWMDGISYEVDRNWGKILLLAEMNQQVIFYSNSKKILAIPKAIQLPRLIAESITLLSGLTPYFKKLELNGKPQIFQLYQNVPKLFAENLFRKFNQNILQNDNI
jgi:hypothetical protein